MFIAIVLGVLAGIIGFLPLFAGYRMTRKFPQAGVAGPMMKLMLGLIVSFVVIFMLAVLFIACDKANGLPFVLSEVIALCVSAIGYGIATAPEKK